MLPQFKTRDIDFCNDQNSVKMLSAIHSPYCSFVEKSISHFIYLPVVSGFPGLCNLCLCFPLLSFTEFYFSSLRSLQEYQLLELGTPTTFRMIFNSVMSSRFFVQQDNVYKSQKFARGYRSFGGPLVKSLQQTMMCECPQPKIRN